MFEFLISLSKEVALSDVAMGCGYPGFNVDVFDINCTH